MASVRTRTVYLPSAPGGAQEFRRSGRLEQAEGISVDVAYARARELDLDVPDDAEEADFWALTDAAMRSLAASPDGPRFVVAVRVRPDQIVSADEAGSGRVTVSGVEWSQVSALFVDEEAALPVVRAARAALADPEAFARESATLLDEHDLLWYAPDELDALLG
ncbi:DUF6912 family protein [Raineyella fluvialis]|uniref:Uncharacterized protein n=1 Tax=Raineyella fluvialis TaxID=2662261 RepID=A0A5Q2FCB0_9ACTN|nr:hypothetical protein [Raineyella fluvialis]QGF24408.1 hypothetical protein Rai3103_12945 [Raineyella fluvialis]